ncbi:unnamed protein product, partial [Mesorhabditis spiculigera]
MLPKIVTALFQCQPLTKTFGAAQERLAQAENRQKDGYEELKDKYVRWATTRGLNDSDSEERQNGARVFVKSFYGIERSDALKKLSEKVAVIEIESPPCEFCIMDQLKSAYYLEPEKFMLLTRVLLQDLQTIYNNANICRLFNEAGYDVAEEGAFDNIDKMAIDTNPDHLPIDESSLLPNARRVEFYKKFVEELDGFHREWDSGWSYDRESTRSACKDKQPQKLLKEMGSLFFQCEPFGTSDVQNTEQLLGLFDALERQHPLIYGLAPEQVSEKLLDEVTYIEKESPTPASDTCVFDQLKTGYYLEPERFMPLIRVLLQDLQILYNNANICRRFASYVTHILLKDAFSGVIHYLPFWSSRRLGLSWSYVSSSLSVYPWRKHGIVVSVCIISHARLHYYVSRDRWMMLAIAMQRDEEHPQIDEAHLIASEQRTRFYKTAMISSLTTLLWMATIGACSEEPIRYFGNCLSVKDDSGCHLHSDFYKSNWTKEDLGKLPEHILSFFNHSDTIAEIILRARRDKLGLNNYASAREWRDVVLSMKKEDYQRSIDTSNFLPNAQRAQFYKEFAQERYQFLNMMVPDDFGWEPGNPLDTEDACKLVQPQKTLEKMFTKILDCHRLGKSDIQIMEDLLGAFDDLEQHPNWAVYRPKSAKETATVSEDLLAFGAFVKRYFYGPNLFARNRTRNDPDQKETTDMLYSAFATKLNLSPKKALESVDEVEYKDLKERFLLWAADRGIWQGSRDNGSKTVFGGCEHRKRDPCVSFLHTRPTAVDRLFNSREVHAAASRLAPGSADSVQQC